MKQNILTLLTVGLLCFNNLHADPSWDLAKVGDKPYPVAGTSIDGAAVSIEALKGKVVLLYFFSIQTGAGVQELKMIQKYMWPEYEPAGLVIVCVAREAQMPELAAFAKSSHMTFPMIPDPQKETFLHFATRGHPRTYVIGKDGTIKLSSLGYTDDELDRISAVIGTELKK